MMMGDDAGGSSLIFLHFTTSLKLGFCGKPNWAQRLNGNISHNFQCILSGNGTFPNISETSGHTLLEMNSNMRAASLQKDKRMEG